MRKTSSAVLAVVAFVVACGGTLPPAPRTGDPHATAEPPPGGADGGTADAGTTATVTAETPPPDEDDEPMPVEPIAARCNVTGDERAFERPSIRRLRGQVSYYHDSLHGRRTASGDRYDRRALTAASRDLPFGTLVRIRRIDGHGDGVIVRVNDRGPFGSSRRILDLSRRAAECLDMIRAGVVEVRAEIIELGSGRRAPR